MQPGPLNPKADYAAWEAAAKQSLVSRGGTWDAAVESDAKTAYLSGRSPAIFATEMLSRPKAPSGQLTVQTVPQPQAQLISAPQVRPATQTVAWKVCPRCSTQLPLSGHFCITCGHQFQTVIPQMAHGAPALPAPMNSKAFDAILYMWLIFGVNILISIVYASVPASHPARGLVTTLSLVSGVLVLAAGIYTAIRPERAARVQGIVVICIWMITFCCGFLGALFGANSNSQSYGTDGESLRYER